MPAFLNLAETVIPISSCGKRSPWRHVHLVELIAQHASGQPLAPPPASEHGPQWTREPVNVVPNWAPGTLQPPPPATAQAVPLLCATAQLTLHGLAFYLGVHNGLTSPPYGWCSSSFITSSNGRASCRACPCAAPPRRASLSSSRSAGSFCTGRGGGQGISFSIQTPSPMLYL